MTDFQKRVFRTVVALTCKKGRVVFLTCAALIFSTIVPLIENTLKVLVRDGAVKSKAGKYSAVAEVKGSQATPEDLE